MKTDFGTVERMAEEALLDAYFHGNDQESAEQAEHERLVGFFLDGMTLMDALGVLTDDEAEAAMASLEARLLDAAGMAIRGHEDLPLAAINAFTGMSLIKQKAAGRLADDALVRAKESRDAERHFDELVFGRAA